MKKFSCIGVLIGILLFLYISTVGAFEVITAAKAYDMLQKGQAFLIDVRTLEECYWVGSPALEPNGMPVGYNIPWKLWPSSQLTASDDFYKPDMVLAKELFAAIFDYLNPDKSTPIITMCRSGGRSSDAAIYLESIGFSEVYEIDNYLEEAEDVAAGNSSLGGRGGFQGSSSNSALDYSGYRGWPGRVDYLDQYPNHNPDWEPTDSSQSVSWMDTGLPMTQKLDVNKHIYYLLGLITVN